jgi:hypothetical protein
MATQDCQTRRDTGQVLLLKERAQGAAGRSASESSRDSRADTAFADRLVVAKQTRD